MSLTSSVLVSFPLSPCKVSLCSHAGFLGTLEEAGLAYASPLLGLKVCTAMSSLRHSLSLYNWLLLHFESAWALT